MNQAAIRTAVRNFIKEQDSDAGTIFPADNTKLDFFIDTALELVVFDLIEFLPEDFIVEETISLVANTATSTLTNEFLWIWSMQRNTTDKSPRQIPFVNWRQKPYKTYVGETAEDPRAFTLKGETIVWLPTPSTAKTDYANAILIVPEAAAMAAGGPAYIPRPAHRLVPLMCAVLIAQMKDQDTKGWEKLYAYFLTKSRDVLGARVQQQPKFLGESVVEREVMTTRDKAFFDLNWPD
ncbi:MAG: hypothetical protein ACXABY_14935 [Candidatus Thorarchaeota archaeon]|jgi:hypothetical protein